jgi:hypothetical protein
VPLLHLVSPFFQLVFSCPPHFWPGWPASPWAHATASDFSVAWQFSWREQLFFS